MTQKQTLSPKREGLFARGSLDQPSSGRGHLTDPYQWIKNLRQRSLALSNGFSLEEEKEVAAENDRPSLTSGNSDDKSERLLLFDNEKLYHSDEPSRNNNNGET